MDWFILEGKIPVKCDDIIQWGMQMENQNRIVAQAHFSNYFVSTVFLGIDHAYYKSKNPILFETMIFNFFEYEWQDRYESWDEAVEGHKIACRIVIPFWRVEMLNSFIWDIFKGVFMMLLLGLFGLFLCVIL